MGSSSPIFRFGPYEVRPYVRELYKHGVKLKLRPQPFQLLHTLVCNPGNMVTREQLRQQLWSAETFVDFEHSLNTAMKELRGVLGDAVAEPRYIETLPRRGYRFVAPVETVSETAPAVMSPTPAQVAMPSVSQEPPKRAWQILVGTSLSVIVALGAYVAWTHLRSQRVIASKTSAAVKDDDSREASDVRMLAPRSAEAHDLCLKAIYFWNKRSIAGFQQAIENFRQATTLDPNYAAAYAGLANSYTLLTAYSSSSASLFIPQARAAAEKALQLDPSLAEAHTAMALIVQNHDWDWQTSENEYRRAIELNPNDATAHQWYAEHLMWLGHFDEALQESRKAQQLDPLSMIIAADQGAILYYSRQYDRAIEQLRSVIRRDPTFQRAEIIINAYVEKRMFAQALAEARDNGIYGHGQWSWAMLAYIYGRAGQFEKARGELNKLERLSQQEEVKPAVTLWAHLGVGDKEGALADLDKACEARSTVVVTLKVEPAFDPLRSDPRFKDLLRRAHLDQ